MRKWRVVGAAGLLVFVLVGAGASARADQAWSVAVDTSRLAADYAGPFGLDFELIGSSGNAVTLGGFSFGGGSAGPGGAFLAGGASGDLGDGVRLDDGASFFSDFNQQFTPGGTLTFTVESTLIPPAPGGTPDGFSIVLFSAYDPVAGYDPLTGTGGTPVPTTDPTGSDTLFDLNINGAGNTTALAYPGANGDLSITVTSAGSVPEPSSGVLIALGLLGALGAACSRAPRARNRPRPWRA